MTAIIDGTLGVSLCAANSVPAGALQAASVATSNLIQPLTLGTAQATTSGTSIDFTGIPSWVKRITVLLNGVSTNGASHVQLQTGAGSVTTSGYSCMTGIELVGSSGSGAITTGFELDGGSAIAAASNTRFGQVIFSTMGANIWCVQGGVAKIGNNHVCHTTGAITLSGTLDRIRLTTVNSTDTFDAGSINILYE